MEAWIALVGAGVISAFGFLIVRVLSGIDSNIGEIKEEIRAFRKDVEAVEHTLHERVNGVERRQEDRHTDHDRRITMIEAKCAVVHREQQ